MCNRGITMSHAIGFLWVAPHLNLTAALWHIFCIALIVHMRKLEHRVVSHWPKSTQLLLLGALVSIQVPSCRYEAHALATKYYQYSSKEGQLYVSDTPGFAPQLCHLTSLWFWIISLASLELSFFNCYMGEISSTYLQRPFGRWRSYAQPITSQMLAAAHPGVEN